MKDYIPSKPYVHSTDCEATITAQAKTIEKQSRFIKAFLENITDCADCKGSGLMRRSKDACQICGGTGKQVKSRGVLLSELEPDASALLAELEEK